MSNRADRTIMTPQQHQAIVDELTNMCQWLDTKAHENEQDAQQDGKAFGRALGYFAVREELHRRIDHHRGRAAVTA